MTSNELRDEILNSCFAPYEGTFASGAPANNKLDMEHLLVGSNAYNTVVRSIGALATIYQPDFCVGVPDGGTGIAMHVANHMEIGWYPLMRSDDDPSTIVFEYEEDEDHCQEKTRGLIVEDVFNRFTSTKRVLQIPPIALRAVVAVAVWDRGMPAEREALSIPTKAVIEEHIPAQLPGDSPLWEAYR